MCLWRDLYDQADPEVKSILDRSNFNSCHEPSNKSQTALHDGYRIDLIYELGDAEERARGMRETYTQLGYTHCKLLTPDEVIAIDPYLAHFCMSHSELTETNSRVWKRDAAALWRPGGCLSVLDLLPPLYEYLKKAMGTYIDASGQVQDCFTVQYEREVTGVALNRDQIAGLKFKDGSTFFHDPDNCHYVFCPGESVGTLGKLGFDEPVFSGFAGAAITLNIPLLTDQVEMYKHFSHCMEVHKVGIVLAWQARFVENRLLLQASGTKAFYGDQAPNNNQAFAKDRHLVQLNMLNDVLSEMLSIAFGRDTRETRLTFNDLEELEKKGILERWVGRRAVAYDGFPTLGALYCKGNKVINARCTTHMGSGGVSFAPAAVEMSRRSELSDDPFTLKILQYADSRR